MSFRTSLARIRGLGSAKQGAHHWWMQRLTGAMSIPLFIGFVGCFLIMVTGDYATATSWLRSPLSAGTFLVLLGLMFYHATLGLQVVIEDYVSKEGARVGAIALARFVMILLAAISAVAVLQVALGGQS